MDNVKSSNRPAWIDRFQQPSIDQLRELLPERALPLFDDTRRRFLQLENVSEHLAWYGDSWFWTVEYRVPDKEEPLGVIIPNPEDLQIAMPVDRNFASQTSTKRLKRAVRDGLELSQEPYDTHWSTWSLTGASIVTELFRLIQQKLKFMAQQDS